MTDKIDVSKLSVTDIVEALAEKVGLTEHVRLPEGVGFWERRSNFLNLDRRIRVLEERMSSRDSLVEDLASHLLNHEKEFRHTKRKE